MDFRTGLELSFLQLDASKPVSSRLSAVGERVLQAPGDLVVLPEMFATGFRNRMLFVRPSGEISWYDKRHLFRPGGETDSFRPGNRREVVEFRGIRFLLLVCYDLRFPVWSRCRGDYDVILCSAAWPESRCDVWRTLLRARALENQAWVVGVNFAGADAAGRYAGSSAIIDCFGRLRAEAPPQGAACRTARFLAEEQSAFRERFPTALDADDFTLTQ